MLIEKLRPKKLSEVVGQKKVVTALKGKLADGEIPHMLFYGNPGVGKTTTAWVVGHTLFKETFHQNFKDYNASDDRGIDFIRSHVKQTAKARTIGMDGPKIIFLDEADALTSDAQNALKRIMEDYHGVCRFILSANTVGKIIPPIASRCSKFHFNDLSEKVIASYLWNTAKKHVTRKVTIAEVKGIARACGGDMRNALNILETGLVEEGATRKDLLKLSAKAFTDLVYKNSGDVQAVFNQLHKEVVASGDVKALVALADADYRMTLGTSKVLQLSSAFAKIKS